MKIRLDQIKDSPRPIRTSWDEDKLNELAKSIKEQGLIVPIKVRPTDNGTYEIVYGHRRVEAMRQTGSITETDAIVEGVDDTEALIQALIENVQREDMEPLDIAHSLRALKTETGWNNMDLERRGIMPNNVASKYLGLLQELPDTQQLISRGTPQADTPKGKVTPRHVHGVRATGLDSPLRRDVLSKAAREHLSSDQTRKVAESIAATKDPRRRKVLLETPYSHFTHDPEWAKERAQRYGEYDPTTVDRKPTQGQQWEMTPEVKAIIDLLREWHGRIPQISESVRQGKFSPEGKRFVLRRVEALIKGLRELAIELED